MNAKTCKVLRRIALFEASGSTTTYNDTPQTRMERLKSRLGLQQRVTRRVLPTCFRGCYLALKRAERLGRQPD